MNKTGWGYVVGSLIGGVLIAGALLLGVQTVVVKTDHNPHNTIVTSGGMTVKLGKVTAELAQTNIRVGSGVGIIVPITDTAKELADVMAMAGVKDTDLLKGNLTVCLSTAVTYKSELNGLISTKIGSECRNFTPGMMASTINTFAEGYTAQTVANYRLNYTFINKE